MDNLIAILKQHEADYTITNEGIIVHSEVVFADDSDGILYTLCKAKKDILNVLGY